MNACVTIGQCFLFPSQFKRASRSPGDDPSVFAIELETLARRTFADVIASSHLQLVRDRFIAGQAECSLHRHLDSVCWTLLFGTLWTDAAYGRVMPKTRTVGEFSTSRNVLGVYQVVNVNMDSKPKVVSEDSDVLGLLMRHLLPTPAVSPPKATPIPSDHELLIQRLLGTVHHIQPEVQERSSITDIEILLQSMLPVGSVAEQNVWPPADCQEPTVVCFSCEESGHVTSRCPVLDESFPFLPPGWRADRTYNAIVLRPLSSSGKRRLIRGRGLVARISDDNEPQFPVVGEDLPCPAARDVVASRVGLSSLWRL